MKYKIRKIWVDSLGLMINQPIVIMPFVIIAFLEALALEVVYFFSRPPILSIAGPIIRKFFGEQFLHYPACLAILPKLFYYLQIAIYIFIGAFLTAVSVNIFKNVKEKLPVRAKAMVRNALKNYMSFFVYAFIAVFIMFILKRLDIYVFPKLFKITAKIFPHIPFQVYSLCLMIIMFVSNIILQVFIILTIPIMVIEGATFIKAFLKSISLGFRNFVSIIALIFLPFLIYLPITVLKSFSDTLINKAFPEITFYITAMGIITSIFLDCFIIICVSQFLLAKAKEPLKNTA